MAQAYVEAQLKRSDSSEQNKDGLECPICLQTCSHPARLPCGHIFCYLCIKGVANQSRRCAMCRQTIPVDYLENPQIVATPEHKETEVKDLTGYNWFYEGKNGWWKYDERTSSELENAYEQKETSCELLIAGLLYVIDFQSMLQMQRNHPGRRRKVKRDLAASNVKGIAGLRLNDSEVPVLFCQRFPNEPRNQPPFVPDTHSGDNVRIQDTQHRPPSSSVGDPPLHQTIDLT